MEVCSKPSVPIGVLASVALLFPLPGLTGQVTDSCSPPPAARYVVMERGSVSRNGDQQPVARLLQESWKADGTIEGTVFERTGQSYRQFRYIGSFRPAGSCRVRLERTSAANAPAVRLDAEAVLDATGRPRYSLSLDPGATITGVWRRQAEAACTATTLSGTVLSQQQGLSWDNGWRPNAVVQRETWTNRRVQGVALSSNAGEVESAAYTGTIELNADCMATVMQQDSEGVNYNYRAVAMADGSGYLYLQQDPGDLTIGWLESVNSHP